MLPKDLYEKKIKFLFQRKKTNLNEFHIWFFNSCGCIIQFDQLFKKSSSKTSLWCELESAGVPAHPTGRIVLPVDAAVVLDADTTLLTRLGLKDFAKNSALICL